MRPPSRSPPNPTCAPRHRATPSIPHRWAPPLPIPSTGSETGLLAAWPASSTSSRVEGESSSARASSVGVTVSPRRCRPRRSSPCLRRSGRSSAQRERRRPVRPVRRDGQLQFGNVRIVGALQRRVGPRTDRHRHDRLRRQCPTVQRPGHPHRAAAHALADLEVERTANPDTLPSMVIVFAPSTESSFVVSRLNVVSAVVLPASMVRVRSGTVS